MKQHINMTPNEAKNVGANNAHNESEVENPDPAENNRVGPNPEVDFSEFMWMEHEEEFDEQVLRELEDEEILNFYYNLTEAENEAEANQDNHPGHVAGSAAASSQSSNGESLVQQITTGLSQIGFSSRLNPDAQEFVPSVRQQRGPTNAVPASSDSSKS